MSETREISLYDTFTMQSEWVKLPVQTMLDCGAAAQTLGSIMRYITIKESFLSAKKISARIWQPMRTYRRHLDCLQEHGYLKNLGRAGPRRTATIRILQRARTAAELDYGCLPWWACTHTIGMPWAARAVLSIVMARLCGIRVALNRHDDEWANGEYLWEAAEEFGGGDKFRFSLADLEKKTGLAKHSIIDAKFWLSDAGILIFHGGVDAQGVKGKDRLFPDPNYRILETRIDPGTVQLRPGFSTDWG